MIDLMSLDLPQGRAILLTAEIGAALSDLSNPKHTVVYTDTFPDGLAVKMPIDAFFELWESCLSEGSDTIEIVFEPDKGQLSE